MSVAEDIILVGAIIFVLGIAFFSVHKIVNDTVTNLRGIEGFNQSANATQALEGSIIVSNRMDYVVFGVFIGLVLFILITGWLIGGHPIFMFVYFIVVILGVVLASLIGHIWETAVNKPIFSTTIDAFPITNNIMGNLPMYIAVIGFIGMIVMFAKPYLIGQEQYY